MGLFVFSKTEPYKDMKKEVEFIELLKRMKRNIKNMLSSRRELNEKEQLERLKESIKDEQRLLDIKAIRTSGDYIPDYNKPKKYTEYQLTYDAVETELYVDDKHQPHIIETVVEKVISSQTKVAYEREIDFIGEDGSTVNALPVWLNYIKDEHLRVVEAKKLKLEQEEKNKQTNYQTIMSKLMKVE